MKWLKEFWHYIVIGVIILVTLLIFLIAFLLTPTGFRFICRIAEVATSHELTLSKPQGSLNSEFSLQTVQWKTSSLNLKIDDIHSQISLRSLIVGTLDFKKLSITCISVQRTTAKNKQTTHSLKNIINDLPKQSPWPNWLTLRAVTIKNIHYQNNNSQALIMNMITLSSENHLKNTSYHITAQTAGTFKSQWQLYLLAMPKQTNLHLVAKTNQQTLELHGYINPKQLYIDSGSLKQGNNHIIASLQYQFGPHRQLNFKSHFHHYLFHKDPLTGYLNFQLSTKNSLQTHINIHSANNSNKIILNIEHKDYWDANWSVKINKIQKYMANSNGVINTTGSLHHLALSGDADINIKRILLGNISLHQFISKWNIEPTKNHTFTMQTNLKTFQYNNLITKNIAISATGNQNKQQFKLDFITPWHQHVTSTAQSHPNPKTANLIVNLNKLNILNGKAIWRLKKPINIQLNSNGISWSPLTLFWQKQNLYIEGNYATTKNWKIISRGNFNLHPESLQNPLFNGLLWTYQISTRGQDGHLLSTQADSKATIHFKSSNMKPANEAAIHLNTQIKYQTNNLSIANTLLNKKTELGSLNLQTKINSFNQLKQYRLLNFNSKVNLHIPELLLSKLFNAFSPTITAKSSLSVTGSFNGSISKPTIQLNGSQPGSLYIAALNKSLNNSSIKITSTKKLSLQAQTTIDKTPITFKATTSPSANSYDSQWTLHSKQVQIINLPYKQFDIIPDMHGSCSNLNCSLSGNVQIPKGIYKIQKSTDINTLPSSSIQFVYNNESSIQPHYTISNLNLDFGHSVNLTGMGLNSYLRGHLTLNQNSHSPLLLKGLLTLHKAYIIFNNNRVNLTTAQISYLQSPANNPTLNLRGQRSIQIFSLPDSSQQSGDVIVGLNITGTLQNPNINLFSSSTALSQMDILSYLLFNQPASSTTLLSGTSLITAFSSGGSSFRNPIDTIKHGLGLTEFGIQSQNSFDSTGNVTTGKNQFVIGKKISKRLYLRYAQTLGNNQNLIMLIYQLNKYWSLQSSQAQDSTKNNGNPIRAIDLMLQFSR